MSKLASIEIVEDVFPHPNADKIEFIRVLGYNIITQKGLYRVGSPVVLIQPDTVLPEDAAWAQSFLKWTKPRVRAMKLRGEFSFGIAVPIFEVFPMNGTGVLKSLLLPQNIGNDISELIGVTKYESPQPQEPGAISSILPWSMSKTDEDRWQITAVPYGALGTATQKVDGSSATYWARKDPETGEWSTGITTRSQQIDPESNNNFTRMDQKYSIRKKLLTYCKDNNVSLALRGEIAGAGIQKHGANPHSKLPVAFYAFRVLNLETLRYEYTEDKHYFLNVCQRIGVPTVAVIGTSIITPEMIKYYAEELKVLDDKKFKGVVINHSKGSFKIINLNYDSVK